MNKDEKKETIENLNLLREPFPEHLIDKLPKPTKAQTDAVKQDYKKGHRCTICGGWHHPKVAHLDYVGHAALTDRLLDVDPFWSWEPMSVDDRGLPAFDKTGGLWIRLTICGVTRIGYGCADGKTGGDAIKEIIGDGLRNSAMRFGAALDLWCKGELHKIDTSGEYGESDEEAALRNRLIALAQDEIDESEKTNVIQISFSQQLEEMRSCKTLEELKQRFEFLCKEYGKDEKKLKQICDKKDKVKSMILSLNKFDAEYEAALEEATK